MTLHDNRLEPTEEDREILMRSVRRLMRWTAEENARGRRRVSAPMLCRITRDAMFDAMDINPGELP